MFSKMKVIFSPKIPNSNKKYENVCINNNLRWGNLFERVGASQMDVEQGQKGENELNTVHMQDKNFSSELKFGKVLGK